MDQGLENLGISSYKKTESQIEFKTSENTELFQTKREATINTFLMIVPTVTLLIPMIWSMFNTYTLNQNIKIISIICGIGMIIEYFLISSLDSNTNISDVKMTFSSKGLEIDSIKRGKIEIGSFDISTIYIKSEESSSSSYSKKEANITYTVICKFNKPITLPINKKIVEEIELFKNFEGEDNLNTAKLLISNLKYILKTRENLNNESEQFFDIGDTTFEKIQNEIRITTTSTDGFMHSKKWDTIDIAFTIMFFSIFIGIPFSVLSNMVFSIFIGIPFSVLSNAGWIPCTIILTCIIALYACYKITMSPNKIFYVINSNEIKMNTDKRQSITIYKKDIKDIYLERKKEFVKTGKNSGYYADYDHIIIELNKKLSLFPMRFLKVDKIDILGNIKIVNNRYSRMMTEEITKILQI